MRNPRPIRIGLLADEPLRLAGLASIFDGETPTGQTPLLPVVGSMEELLTCQTIEYLLMDLSSSSGSLETLETVHRSRPALQMIVIGPEGNDELVLESIQAGARAYLDLSASTEVVRQAIDVVTSGSIWAPRRLLSKLIDRLLANPDPSLSSANPYLTVREHQVLEHILKARSNREIAQQLGIEERTVKAHMGRLMRKAGVDNRIELSMRVMNGSVVPGIGIPERRRGDRRQSPRSSTPPSD
jgi:DNA-binding NarL/FixJ family response regulator